MKQAINKSFGDAESLGRAIVKTLENESVGREPKTWALAFQLHYEPFQENPYLLHASVVNKKEFETINGILRSFVREKS